MNPTQVNQFMGTNFVKKNYDPPTGIGRFDFDFSPGLRQITVRVKAQYNFLVPAGTNGHLQWKEMQKSDFKKKASKVIERAWSNRYKFVCAEPNVAARLNSISVRVLFDEEASLADAHYRVDARRVARDNPNPSELWAGGCNHGAGVAQYNANFSNWGVEKRELFGSSEIFNFKEQQIKERFAALNMNVLPMLHGSSTKVSLPATDGAKLQSFAKEARSILDGDTTGIYCRVYGCSTEKHIGIRAHSRAEQFVKTFGPMVPNFFKADGSAAGKKIVAGILQGKGLQLGGFSGLVLYIDAPKSAGRRQVRTDYVVITHEFGHMIGCPDEYNAVQCTRTHARMQLDDLVPSVVRNSNAPVRNRNNDVTERQRGQQKAFEKIATAASVKTPAFFSPTAGNIQEYTQQSQTNQAQKDALAQQFQSVGGRSSDEYKRAVAQLPPVVDMRMIKSDSIMYTGQKVLPAHYLPIWACLTEQTNAFINPAEWSIQEI